MLTIGIFSALGLLLLALKTGGKKTIGHDIFVDIIVLYETFINSAFSIVVSYIGAELIVL